MSAEVEAARQVIVKHAEQMRGYTLPSIDYAEGYMHALRLLERDSGFIAYDILASPALAARDAARDAALREKLAVEVEAEAPGWDFAGGVARDAYIRIADRIRRGVAQ